jgi:hypothetical protein
VRLQTRDQIPHLLVDRAGLLVGRQVLLKLNPKHLVLLADLSQIVFRTVCFANSVFVLFFVSRLTWASMSSSWITSVRSFFCASSSSLSICSIWRMCAFLLTWSRVL